MSECAECKHLDHSTKLSRELIAHGFSPCSQGEKPPRNLDFYPLNLGHNCPKFEQLSREDRNQQIKKIRFYSDFLEKKLHG